MNRQTTIQVNNASVTAFKGERQLRLGKNGTITVLANQVDRTKHQSEAVAENAIYVCATSFRFLLECARNTLLLLFQLSL